MKVSLKFIKLLVSFSFLFIILLASCELVKTYSEDEYLALSKKSSDKKSDPIAGSSDIQVVVEDLYTVNNGGSFNFDGNIPANERTLQVVFKIYNNGTEPLTLTGAPGSLIQIDNLTDFTINQASTSSTIPANSWTSFGITFTSSATDNAVKQASITVPNNNPDNSTFTFTINCTSKATNEQYFYVGTSTWNCPAYNATVTLTLVGGGGGGGGGAHGDEVAGFSGNGGDGGHAGQINSSVIPNVQYNASFSITVGNGGSGGSNGDPNGENGNTGEPTTVTYNLSVFQATGGLGGTGGVGIGGNPEGEDGESGYNSAPGGDGGYYLGEDGGNGTNHSGAGGGSGSGGDYDIYGSDGPGGNGGNGGSGLCIIKWVGFLIP